MMFGFMFRVPPPSLYGVPILTASGATVIHAVQTDLGVNIGTGISTWKDQSSSAKDLTQATGSKQPSYLNTAATCLNGLPVAQLVSANNTQMSAALTRGAASTNPTTYLTVYRTDTWHATGASDVVWSDAGGGGLTLLGSSVTPQLQSQCSTPRVNGAATVGSWFRVVETASNSAGDKIKIGGTTVTGTSGNNSIATTNLSLGFATAGRTMSCSLMCHFMLSAVASATTEAVFDQFVLAKYGALVGR